MTFREILWLDWLSSIENTHRNSELESKTLKYTSLSYYVMWSHDMLLNNTINEPVHEISNNVVCATSKASDQPAHTRSLIRAFASRLSILRLLSYWLNTILTF